MALSNIQVLSPVQYGPRTMSGPEGSSIKRIPICAAVTQDLGPNEVLAVRFKMSYQVIARKYRPQTFTEIVGQIVTVRTLQNAILRNRISHAYLFSGPRGVGKTTIARILAKALNCRHGPTVEPCLQCVACTEITRGNALDVIEIDAASNRGIDEIRELRNSVQYGAARDRFKIFIVDEAHMLTHEAFNALLKTLEEPPVHVVFILATTEKQKLPVTIVSRCQPFDFQLIATSKIVALIRQVASSENLAISDRAIEQIALSGEGSLRDALSMLDQVINYGDSDLTDEDVSTILGEIDVSFLERISTAVAAGNRQEILAVLGDVCDAGYDLQHFCRRLLQHFRNMLVSQATGGDPKLLNLPESQVRLVGRLAEKFSQEDLLRFLETIAKTESEMRWAYYPRFNLELALLKLSYLPHLRPLTQFMSDLKLGREIDSNPTVERGVRAPTGQIEEVSRPEDVSPHPISDNGVDSRDLRVGEFLRATKMKEPILGSWLDMAQSIDFLDGQLSIVFSKKFSIQYEKLLEHQALQLLNSVCGGTFGDNTKLNITLEDRPAKIEVRTDLNHSPSRGDEALMDKVKREPILRSFLETFPGKVSVEEKEP